MKQFPDILKDSTGSLPAIQQSARGAGRSIVAESDKRKQRIPGLEGS
jgi:hypothetical protein